MPSQSPSQSAILLSELRFVLPLIVLPLTDTVRESVDFRSERFAWYGKANIYHVQVICSRPPYHGTYNGAVDSPVPYRVDLISVIIH